ncbi:hypothetical protein HG530_002951 [Fusarium avenaceum]|nr:hypothetical protein HG530_002951 [Fusarium avenaceum]
MDVRNTCQSCKFHRINQAVVSQVKSLKRDQLLDTSKTLKPVRPKIEGGDSRKRTASQRLKRIDHAVRQVQGAEGSQGSQAVWDLAKKVGRNIERVKRVGKGCETVLRNGGHRVIGQAQMSQEAPLGGGKDAHGE